MFLWSLCAIICPFLRSACLLLPRESLLPFNLFMDSTFQAFIPNLLDFYFLFHAYLDNLNPTLTISGSL